MAAQRNRPCADWLIESASQRCGGLVCGETPDFGNSLAGIAEQNQSGLRLRSSTFDLCALSERNVCLDDDDRGNPHGPYYQSVIGIARDLVTKTINQLDSVMLRPILARAREEAEFDYSEIDADAGRNPEVKESPPEYVH